MVSTCMHACPVGPRQQLPRLILERLRHERSSVVISSTHLILEWLSFLVRIKLLHEERHGAI